MSAFRFNILQIIPSFNNWAPLIIPRHVWEIPPFAFAFKMVLPGKYLASSTYAHRVSENRKNHHVCLASMAMSKTCRSRNPKPPPFSTCARIVYENRRNRHACLINITTWKCWKRADLKIPSPLDSLILLVPPNRPNKFCLSYLAGLTNSVILWLRCLDQTFGQVRARHIKCGYLTLDNSFSCQPWIQAHTFYLMYSNMCFFDFPIYTSKSKHFSLLSKWVIPNSVSTSCLGIFSAHD